MIILSLLILIFTFFPQKCAYTTPEKYLHTNGRVSNYKIQKKKKIKQFLLIFK